MMEVNTYVNASITIEKPVSAPTLRGRTTTQHQHTHAPLINQRPQGKAPSHNPPRAVEK